MSNQDTTIQDDGAVRVDYPNLYDGQVAWVAIDHAQRRNAISPGVISSLKAAFDDLAGNEKLRAVVLAGDGRTFAAGADVRVLAGLTPDTARAFITNLHEAIDAVRCLPVPVIARLTGHCLGAAVELAAACDLRIGDNSVVIGMPEVRVGLPSVIEAVLLPALIGPGRAREMLLTGRNYNAIEAEAMGYLQTLTGPDALDAAIDGRLRDVLASGPRAVRSQKALLNAWQEPGMAEAIAISIDAFAAAYETDEPAEMLAPHLKPGAA
jgi:enoyl-CoA hydratase/carnithine racemase